MLNSLLCIIFFFLTRHSPKFSREIKRNKNEIVLALDALDLIVDFCFLSVSCNRFCYTFLRLFTDTAFVVSRAPLPIYSVENSANLLFSANFSEGPLSGTFEVK